MTTKVYVLCDWGPEYGDGGYAAVTEYGEVIAQHISSSRGWGLHDVGPTGFYKDRYPTDAEVIEVPHGEGLPPAVHAAKELWSAVSAAVVGNPEGKPE